MKPTSFRLIFALAAALALGPACLAQSPDPMTPAQAAPAPDQTAPVPDPGQPVLDPGQPAPMPPAAPPAPVPPPALPPAPILPPVPAAPVDPYANILGPEVKVLGYGIRPPKNYTYMALPIVPGRKRRDFAWQGALHQDGYVTSLVVGVTRLTAEPNAEREFMVGFFKSLSRTLTDAAMSSTQPGTIGGMPALRATWAGKLRTTHSRLVVQGFIYVIQDGTIGVSVAGTDSVPSFAATFPALNASALSLHK